MDLRISQERSNQIATALLAFLIIISAFFVFKAVNELRRGAYPTGYVNTISVVGEGSVFAVPDTATFTFTVSERANTVEEAQTTVSEQASTIITALRQAGVEENNIKTVGYNVFPRYEYQEAVVSGGGTSGSFRPIPGREVLVGYEVTQTTEVKVEDTDLASRMLTEIGTLGADNVSGLNFTVDDEDEIREEATALAIEDARESAERLARDLGVRIVRVAGFHEESGPQPYYRSMEGLGGMDMAVEEAVQSMPIEVGENEIISRVTITYEIR